MRLGDLTAANGSGFYPVATPDQENVVLIDPDTGLPYAANSVEGGGGDATAANQTLANTKLDAVIAATDGLEALIGTTNTKLQSLLDDNTAAATYSPPRFVSWTPSVDTSAIAAGDVIADTEVISGFGRASDVGSVLIGINVVDKSDNTVENLDLTFVFFNANVSLGTENAAPSITDTNAENIRGIWRLQSTDWVDIGGAKYAFADSERIPLQMIAGTDDVAVAIYSGNSGTPTFAASALVVTFVLLD